ncbi:MULTISPECIES: hypothetical protein [Myxococcus]|uniref:hypothetical protein n=1 Tax=Myxococcus TaxID=32 RepID=UPI0013D2DC7F|nr:MULTISPECIES: hypothetical protein [Myxococcus]NVJ26296.1 hypothetical protein [Myxococcus sp. AM011]
MMTRPFKVSHRPLLPPTKLELVVVLESPLSGQEHPFAPLDYFQQVAALGGLGGETLPPSRSSLRLSSHEQLPGNTWSWRFDAVQLHASSLFILENVLHDIHLEGPHIQQAIISSGLLAPSQRGPEPVLPFAYEPLPFEYIFEAESTEAFIEVDFAKAQGTELLRDCEVAWWSWLGLVQRGGFAEATFPPGTLKTFLAKAPVISSHGLQFFLDDVTAGGEAFDSLVNMLHAIHLRGATIECVRVS